jgi:hypothetical protein
VRLLLLLQGSQMALETGYRLQSLGALLSDHQQYPNSTPLHVLRQVLNRLQACLHIPDVIAPQASGAVVPGPPFSMAAVMATTSASI